MPMAPKKSTQYELSRALLNICHEGYKEWMWCVLLLCYSCYVSGCFRSSVFVFFFGSRVSANEIRVFSRYFRAKNGYKYLFLIVLYTDRVLKNFQLCCHEISQLSACPIDNDNI